MSTTPRISGPCTAGDHDYCLGPHMILPCTCNCHEHTDPEQRPQVNTHTTVLLPIDDLPEDVAIGHLAEMRGLIPHDVARADTFRNALCRNHLRLAEAWAAGYQAGKRATKGDNQ